MKATCLHDKIALELLKGNSLAALIWLVGKGREVGFSCRSHECFISTSGSKSLVSLWVDGAEQPFDDVEELVSRATIGGVFLKDAWADACVSELC